MQRKTLAIVVVMLLGAAVAAYFFMLEQKNGEPSAPTSQEVAAPPAAASAAPVPPPPSTATGSVEPTILHPLDAAPGAKALPELDASDAPILKELTDALGKNSLDIVLPEALIRKIVATIDYLPRKRLPAEVVPLKRASGAFVTTGKGDTLAIGARNSARYSRYVRVARSLDTVRLVSVYRRLYPLFQRAYAEISLPNAYFNDRLVEAIDDLLAAPELAEPIRLVQPGILYEFAEPELESRSAGQKIMMRIGRDNAAQIKAKLREIRQQVAKASGD